MAGSQRNVSVRFTAEVQGFKRAMEEAAKATEKAKRASEDAGKAADKSADEIAAQALAHHEAAKAVGLQYDNTGQLVTMNGKAVSSQQAATHGLQTFSAEAYLAGRAAVAAGEEADAAAKVAAEAEAAAAEAAKEHKSALEEVAQAAAIGGGAVVAGVGLAVHAYADFDKQMSSVDSATHETAGNMQLLRQAAIDAGADTAFSAGEAAQGIEELAKAGVSTKDILNGGLNGSLALAAAGSLDVGTAAEIAASALTQFKLSGDQVPHVADLLAAGAGKAQGSVEDLGAALNQSGLVAASTGLTIEETTGALSAFASAGLTGSDAGTSFKTMLMSLNPNSKEAAGLMDELGIRAYDAQGKFVGMSEYAGILQNALKGMSDEQRNATLKTIFGSDAVRAANVLYEQGADGINKWEKAVNDAGYAADTAARMQNNLAGDLEKLGGSFDTVLIQSGSGANDVLRGLVQGLEGLVDTVGKVPAPVLAAATGLAAVVGGAALLAGGLVAGISKVRDLRDAFDTIAPAGGRARGALASVGKAAGVAAVAMVALQVAGAVFSEKDKKGAEDFGQALLKVANAGKDVSGSGLDSAFQGWGKNFGVEAVSNVNNMSDAVREFANQDLNDQINKNFADPLNSFFGFQKTHIGQITDRFKNLGDEMGNLARSGGAETAAKSFSALTKEFEKNGKGAQDALDAMPGYKDALNGLATSAGVALTPQELLDFALGKVPASMQGATTATETYTNAAGEAKPVTEGMAKALEEVGLAADGSVTDIDKFAQSLFAAGLLSLSASDASIAYQDAIDKIGESIKANGTSLDINTEKGRANQSAFNGLAQAAITSAEAHAKETLASQGSAAAQAELQTSLRASYDDLVAAAGQFGITGDAADTMARKALGIPKEVPIDTWVNDNASATLDGIKGKTDALNGKVVTIVFQTDATGFYDPSAGTDGQGAGSGSKRKAPGAFATGGRLPGFADGGQLPTTGPGAGTTDGFLGISSAGVPLARVDAGEWIIKRSSSARYNRELAAINAGTFPKLPGFAAGGRAYAAHAYAAPAGGNAGTTFDFSGAQFTALDPVQLRRDIVDDVTFKINSKSGVRVA